MGGGEITMQLPSSTVALGLKLTDTWLMHPETPGYVHAAAMLAPATWLVALGSVQPETSYWHDEGTLTVADGS